MGSDTGSVVIEDTETTPEKRDRSARAVLRKALVSMRPGQVVRNIACGNAISSGLTWTNACRAADGDRRRLFIRNGDVYCVNAEDA